VAARGSLVESTHPVAGTIKVVAPPVRMSDTPGAVRTPAPLLGQHTEEVLRDRLGMKTNEIARLRDARVIRVL
jgi:CoA:oxalate CoA-transferase